MSHQTPPAFDVPAAFASRGLALRTATDADLAFQRILFETARPDAALFTAWPDAMRVPFLDQQFHFQTIHYSRVYPDADRLIVCAHDEPIGRLIVDRAADAWCIVDIALLPAWRGRGIGAQLLRMVQAAAASRARTMHLTVNAGNAAQHLYVRLGFVVTDEAPPNIAMAWRPPRAQLKTA
jgi:ribosomal protein S18 acetylase RimI-like enzyme